MEILKYSDGEVMKDDDGRVYVKEGHGVCPYCGNKNVWENSITVTKSDDGPTEVKRYMICQDFENCDGGWYELYDVTHRLNIRYEKEPFKAFAESVTVIVEE